MKSPISRKTFDVHEYHRMVEAGILAEDDRIELIEEELTEMCPIESRHAAYVMRLTTMLEKAIGKGRLISVQNPIKLSDFSEPEPDLGSLRYREDFYASKHPTPEDTLLVIEVSDTSLEHDRGVELPLYARMAYRRWGLPLWSSEPSRSTLSLPEIATRALLPDVLVEIVESKTVV